MSGDGYFQDGDQLSEGNLGKALLADNNKDYVDRGGGITGPSNGDITVEAGQVFIEDTASEQLYKVYPPEATLTLPNATGDNYVYATFDPDVQDSAQWEITDTQGSGLANPVRLLRAVVDGGAGTVELRNDAPSGTFESANIDSATIGGLDAYKADDNNPISGSGSSVSHSFSDAYDILILEILDLTTNGGTDLVELQINGITTSDYTNIKPSGGSNADSWELGTAGEFGTGQMAGSLKLIHDGYVYSATGSVAGAEVTDPLIGGSVNDKGTDRSIDSITFTGSSGVVITANVYGR